MDSDMTDEDMDRFGIDFLLGPCGVCPRCMEDKFMEGADLVELRAAEHRANPKPSENKENNMWLKSAPKAWWDAARSGGVLSLG